MCSVLSDSENGKVIVLDKSASYTYDTLCSGGVTIVAVYPGTVV